MKKFLTTLVLIEVMLFQSISYGGNVPAGQNLIPPTVNSRIIEDTSGNIQFMDAVAGPVTLTNLAGATGFTAAAGNLQFGSATTAISTATSVVGLGNVFTALLAPGTVAAVQGSVLIATTTQNNLVTVQVAPTVTGLTNVVGVAVTAASTGSVVNVYSNGWVLALASSTVNPGDILVSTSVSAGYLATNNSATANQQVGIALQSNPSATANLIKIKLR